MQRSGLSVPGFTTHQNIPVSQVDKILKGSMDAESKFVEIDGLNMHYYEAGNGPPLLLVHGWLCSGAFWKCAIPELSKKYRVYAVDLIGHGISDKPVGGGINFSTENQATWLIEFMEKTGIENAFLAGHSMGGEIAARVAMQAPERISKLILIGAIGLEKNPLLIPWYLKVTNAFPSKAPLGWFFTEPAFGAFNTLCMVHKENPVDKEPVSDIVLQNTNTKQDTRSLVKVTSEGLFRDFIDNRLHTITAPTLCIWGRHDKVVPPQLGETYAERIPEAKLMIIENAGHMVPWEKAAQVNNAILAFCGTETKNKGPRSAA